MLCVKIIWRSWHQEGQLRFIGLMDFVQCELLLINIHHFRLIRNGLWTRKAHTETKKNKFPLKQGNPWSVTTLFLTPTFCQFAEFLLCRTEREYWQWRMIDGCGTARFKTGHISRDRQNEDLDLCEEKNPCFWLGFRVFEIDIKNSNYMMQREVQIFLGPGNYFF